MVVLMLLLLAIAMTACGTVKPQLGGHASTMFSGRGKGSHATLTQSQNPKEPSSQIVESEETPDNTSSTARFLRRPGVTT